MILFVEDEFYFMAIYREYLEQRFVVEHVSNPDDALAFMRNQGLSVDLIILDIMMPPGTALKDLDHNRGRLTGLRLMETIRQDFPSLPFVILTAVTMDEPRALLEAQPLARLLLKPVTLTELEQAVDEFRIPERPR